MTYSQGDRVQVSNDYHWAKCAFGTVGPPPGPVVDLVSDDNAWAGCRRVVQGVKGPIEFYWVVFDEPQVDAEGDGPYASAEIQAEYLRFASTTAEA
jgi:hypothetical protein